MLDYCESIKVSMEVIKKLRKQLSNNSIPLWVESHANGREQGFCIRSSLVYGEKACIVTQARGSDSILLIPGHGYKEIEPFTNTCKNDEVYFKNRWYGTVDEAVEFLVNYFTGA